MDKDCLKMAREIINPRWGNQEKTQIIAKFRYDDGRELIASISNPSEEAPNPDWVEIMEKFGAAEIDRITEEDLQGHIQRKQAKIEQRQLNIERVQKEVLFNAKAEAFDLDIVRNSTNRDLKNKIRRASSITEVYVYTALLHMIEDPIAKAALVQETDYTHNVEQSGLDETDPNS